MFFKRDRVLLIILLLIQVIVVFITFREVLSLDNKFLLVNAWDGLKNYFTYYAYIKQPDNVPLLHFAQLNYPFGDTVLYTDNTPLLSVLIRILVKWFNIVPYSLVIHNAFMVAGIIISSAILYRIFRNFSVPQAMAFIASLLLPWVSPQVLRLKIGHYNLSFSWVLLLVIYLLLKLYNHYPNRKKSFQITGLLIITLVLSAFLHMYYLLLNLSFIGFFFMFWFIQQFIKTRKPVTLLLLLGIFNVLIPTALVLAIIRLPDKNYQLRRTVAEGYDRLDWKLNLEAFTTPYPFTKVKLKLLSFGEVPYESYLYLGLFFIATVIVGLVLAIYLRKKTAVYDSLGENNSKKYGFFWLFGLAALACGFIALGESYSFLNGNLVITNYLNLFYYIHKFSELVTQFRVLSRFAWIIFWFCNIGAVCWLGYVLQKYPNRIFLKMLPIGLFFLLYLDARDSRKYLSEAKAPNVMSDPEQLQFMNELKGNMNASQFQAILPIPYFHEGSEDYDITLFPDDEFFKGTIQLSEVTGLPVMGSKLSRTPPEQVKHFLSIFLAPKSDTALTNALNAKPVLVLYNSAYYNGKNKFYETLNREPALTAYKNGEDLPTKKGWEKLAEKGDYIIYKADLK